MTETQKLALVGEPEGASLVGDRIQLGRGTLLEHQGRINYEVTSTGDLFLTQVDELGNVVGFIAVRRDVLMAFIDRLTDAIGIGGGA